jgi:radical SAM/Cys-rich protein
VIASLPCYTPEPVDRQRGRSVYDRSIEALVRLGELGHGRPESPLKLDLVFNPQDATLPPPQAELEATYRVELRKRHGIEFDHLLTITNMPIKRFARWLARQGSEAAYLSLLVNHFNPNTVSKLMCRELLSVDHEGRLFDCDFNQMLALPLLSGPRTVWDITDLEPLEGNPIVTDSHCFACTAGAGSSCGGALS